MRTIATLVAFCGMMSVVEAGPNWPGFRGPRGDGHSDAAEVPLTWSETKNIAWKTAIPGQGWSSPVVWGSQIWLTTATPDGKELFAIGVDLASGRLVHQIKVFDVDKPHPKIAPQSSYASPTPVIEEGRLYVTFGTYGTACLNTADGSRIWERRDLILDHKEGAGSSLLLVENLLILPCDGQDVQYLIALDKRTGKTVWKTERSFDFSNSTSFHRKAYSTPFLADLVGGKQLISAGGRAAYSYDPQTGKERWRVTYPGWSNVSVPVCTRDLVIISGGLGQPSLLAVRPDGAGDVTESHVAWKLTKGVPGISSPLLVEDHLFVCTDRGIAACLEVKTGKALWQERLGADVSASPVLVAGRMYFPREDGKTMVLQPGPTFKVLAVNTLEGQIKASPAVVGKALILRTDTHLYRIEEP